jgi:hypothetical protein
VAEALLAECRTERESFVETAPGAGLFLPFSGRQRLAQFPKPDPLTPPASATVLTAALERLESMCHILRVSEQGRRTLYRTSFLRLHLRLDLAPERVCARIRTVEQVGKLFDKLEGLYFRACVEAGEAVGLSAAENIAEPLTQLVLNAFHTTGEGSIASTQGIPRLNELIDATHRIQTPSMSLFYIEGSEATAAAVRLPQAGVEVFVKEAHVFLQPGGLYSSVGLVHEDGAAAPELPASFLNEQRLLVATTGLLRRHWELRYAAGGLAHSPFVIVLVLEDEEAQSLTSSQVASLVRAYLGELTKEQSARVFVEASAPGMRHRFVRIRITNSEDVADKARADLLIQHPLWGDIRLGKARRELYHFMTHSLCRQILARVKVGRMATVSGASVVVPNDRLSRHPDEPRVVTAGTALRESWDQEEFDWRRSFSNDVHEVERALGVEAAALCLFKELRDILSAGGSSIADRHIELISSIMTCSGSFTPLTRFGDARLGKTSAIVRTSFEQQNTHIIDAGVYAERDEVKSLADSIVVGRRPPIGTGAVELMLDPTYIEKARTAARIKRERRKDLCDETGGIGSVKALLHNDPADKRERERAKLEVFESGTGRGGAMPWKGRRGKGDGTHVPTFASDRRVDPSEILGPEQVRRFTLADPRRQGPGLQGCLAGQDTAPMMSNEQVQRLLGYRPTSPKISGLPRGLRRLGVRPGEAGAQSMPSPPTMMSEDEDEDEEAPRTAQPAPALDLDSIAQLLRSLAPMIRRLDTPLYSADGVLNDEEFVTLVHQIL